MPAIKPTAPPPARLAGFFYLGVFACGLAAAGFIRLIAPGDAAATANNIVASEAIYRFGFTAQVVMHVCYVPVTLIFYELFKAVNKSVSLLAAYFSLIGIAVGAVSLLNYAAPWILLDGGNYADVIATPERQALAYAFLKLASVGFYLSLVVFGSYCVLIGLLIVRSTFVPRLFGALMTIGGICYLGGVFVSFLALPIAAQISGYFAYPGALAELLLSLWLFFFGVNAGKWRAQAGVA